ncbi:MAG: TIGR03862 family flavoprotein [Proteobacteria bacterium]|nr:TIGR03862 family flavoprotein [Pseudomonadota bacterium]
MGVDAQYGFVVTKDAKSREVAIIGAGPAGLFAAEIIARAGHRVTVYERMPSPARKFLLAGRGGLNLTHSEPLETFLSRYGDSADEIRGAVEAFPPAQLIAWADGLEAHTFVGSSGRVFPNAMKASPLLRAWLRRLDDLGVVLKTRHRWSGFVENNELSFEKPDGTIIVKPDASLFALGGASWPKLGSDGRWIEPFSSLGVASEPLAPANCGVVVPWSAIFKSRFEGCALKRVALSIGASTTRGEVIITKHGLEGGAIYALIPLLRTALATHESATLAIDLKPDMDVITLAERLSKRRPKETLTNFLRKSAHLDPAAIALLREEQTPVPENAEALAARIKAVSVNVTALSGLDRAISTAGGIAWSELDNRLMVRRCPGVFVAGEMLDWEAPTGGYLLQATIATAFKAAKGLLNWLDERQ